MSVKILMVGYQFRPSLFKAVEKVNDKVKGFLKFAFFNAYDVDKGVISKEEFVDALNDADIVLIDVRGGDVVSKLLIDALSSARNKTVVTLVGGSSELINLTRLGSFSLSKLSFVRDSPFLKRFIKSGTMNYGKIVEIRDRFEKLGSIVPFGVLKHARNYSLILKYYEHPCEENFIAMLLLLIKEYGGVKVYADIPKPKVMPSMGILDFHTEEVFVDVEEYLASYKFGNRPLVGILFYGGHHYDQSLPAAMLLASNLEKLGFGVLPVFCSDLRYYLAIERFFFKDGRPLVKAAIDLLWFRLAGGPIGGDHRLTLSVLGKLKAPMLHGVHLSSLTIDEWEKSQAGIPPIEMVTTVVLPELDGRIEPHVTHAPRKVEHEGIVLEEYGAIEDRVEKLAKRAAKWVNLKLKPSREKRVAIILYNYPPGEENLGKVAYLNVFESLHSLLSKMKEHGYMVDRIPAGAELKDLLLKSGAVNSGEWTLTPRAIAKLPKVHASKYLKWFSKLPEDLQRRIKNVWGEPPGDIMVYEGSILIPGITLGNVFIGVQPSRGVHEDPTKIYHKRDLPPHHQYVAFYKWIAEEFKADAIIHFGTHGTLEFLPGKDAGLSSKCFPDILIGDLPNIYIYHVVNASEAAIAKHRSYAVIVNHSSPPITTGGVHSFLEELERLLNQYYEALQYGEARASQLASKALSIAKQHGLGESIDEVHDRLYEYKRSLVPKGLHVLGRQFTKEELLNYLTSIARYDRGVHKSLHRVIAEAKRLNYDEMLDKPSKIAFEGKPYSQILDEIEATVRKLIERYIFNEEPLDEILKNLKLTAIDTNNIAAYLSYLKDVKNRVQTSNELEAVLRALSGEYITPGPGGDLVRTPEVFPTGRNTYQLDPTNIPSDIAMDRGVKIAEECIRQFYEKHGHYPRAVSVVLWGFETMKTGGETIAAIFRLLGVKPVWKSIYVRDLEVIPLKELGRPRIDVLVTICGIFRDTFYNMVELLDRAFKLVVELDEPLEWNYVKANHLQIVDELGKGELLRIFGPPDGEYATTLTNLVETGAWKTESDLVQAYLDSMRYAYGVDVRGIEAEKIFNLLLARVDVVAQVRDSIDYEITDLDHYYEFLGGLSKSVESLKGSMPLILVADTTKERVKVEGVSEAIRRGVITRLLNPRWIKGMLEHGFSGAAKIADRIEYLLGLAATTGGVENWMWDQIAEKIALNEEVSKTIVRENPWALQKMVKRLLEANKRGYWKAQRDVLKKLEEKYLEVEGVLEDAFS